MVMGGGFSVAPTTRPWQPNVLVGQLRLCATGGRFLRSSRPSHAGQSLRYIAAAVAGAKARLSGSRSARLPHHRGGAARPAAAGARVMPPPLAHARTRYARRLRAAKELEESWDALQSYAHRSRQGSLRDP